MLNQMEDEQGDRNCRTTRSEEDGEVAIDGTEFLDPFQSHGELRVDTYEISVPNETGLLVYDKVTADSIAGSKNAIPIMDDDGDDRDDDRLPNTDVDSNESSSWSTDDEEYDETHYPNTPESTDEELENLEIPKKRKRERVSGDFKNFVISLGQEFMDKDEFRAFLTNYSLCTGYDIRIERSAWDKIDVVCSAKGCQWRVYASIEPKSRKWLVKILDKKHTCMKSGRTKMLKIGEITKMFLDRIRRKPKFKAAEMKDEIKRQFNMVITRNMCSKAKRRALDIVRGNFQSQFAKVKDYAAELRRSNPGTTAVIETKGTTNEGYEIFHRFYICFSIIKRSWKDNCRPVIGLDGCFLKWDTQSQLLAAVERDANNRIYPIAWAIVEIENIDNWEWFISHMKEDLDLGDGDGLTCISDKQKGLLNAMAKVLPHAEHRMCARHIYSNWRKNHREGMLKPLFWQVAQSWNEDSFNENMEVIKFCNLAAYESLIASDPRTWSRAFFKTTSRCQDCHNNLSESFNNTIREARMKPILDMLEDIRRATMERITNRKVIADGYKEKFTPKANEALEEAREEARHCHMFSSTDGVYEIEHLGLSYPVSLHEKTCDCREWDLTGIPCMHAICAIHENGLHIEDFVSDYYLASKWQATYRHSLNPIRRETAWPKVDEIKVIPSTTVRKKAGKPKKHDRIKPVHESPTKSKRLHKLGYQKRCSQCRAEGHTKTTCPKRDQPQIPDPDKTRRPRGRPRIQDTREGQSNQPRRRRMNRTRRQFEKGSTSVSMNTTDQTTDTRRSSSVSQQCSSQGPYPSQSSQQSFPSEHQSQQSFIPCHPNQQSFMPWNPSQQHRENFIPPYPDLMHNQTHSLTYTDQPYPHPQPNQSYHLAQPNHRPQPRTLGRKKERVPQGYGLYISTKTNNMFFRRGHRRVEMISEGRRDPSAL